MSDSSPPQEETDPPEEIDEISSTVPEPLPDRIYRLRYPLLAAMTALVIASALAVRLTREDPNGTPVEQYQALIDSIPQLGEESIRRQAARTLERLQESGFEPVDFTGTISLVEGLILFETARSSESGYFDADRYRLAAAKLIQAERAALPNEFRSQWASSLGLSLYNLDRDNATGPLREAWLSRGPYRAEVGMALADSILRGSVLAEYPLAEKVIEELLTDVEENAPVRSQLNRLRCRIAMERGDIDLAEKLLGTLGNSLGDDELQFLHARYEMAKSSWREANDRLERVAARIGISEETQLTARLLMGRCSERRGQAEEALARWRSVVESRPGSDHALAAHIWSGVLLRSMDRDEEALTEYRAGLVQYRSTPDRLNPWLSRQTFRGHAHSAWTEWLDEEDFLKAIAIAEQFQPLFDELVAQEIVAKTHERWAETLEAEAIKTGSAETDRHARERLDQWRRSGVAWADYVRLLDRSEDRSPALWKSAEHFRKAHAFEDSLRQIDTFLEDHSGQLVPIALTRRGRMLIAKDELVKAREHFEQVLRDYPNSPVVYEARLWLGRSLLEAGNSSEAAGHWKAILNSPELRPDAIEWKLALFELANLNYLNASTKQLNQTVNQQESQDQTPVTPTDSSFSEAAKLLRLFTRRYPNSPETMRVRFRLGQALLATAEEHRTAAERAETSNARTERLKRRRRDLMESEQVFTAVAKELEREANSRSLSQFEQELLQRTSLLKANSQFYLERYADALAAYIAYTNIYAQDRNIVMAYLRTAECYEQLGQFDEARSIREHGRLVLRKQRESEEVANPDALYDVDGWERWLTRAQSLDSRGRENQ